MSKRSRRAGVTRAMRVMKLCGKAYVMAKFHAEMPSYIVRMWLP